MMGSPAGAAARPKAVDISPAAFSLPSDEAAELFRSTGFAMRAFVKHADAAGPVAASRRADAAEFDLASAAPEPSPFFFFFSVGT